MPVKLSFTNGLMISAELNGNCFITDARPDFPDDLSSVTVESDEEFYKREYHNVELIECTCLDSRYWFALRERSPEEMRQKELDDTIQMLTDCLLEMSELIYS